MKIKDNIKASVNLIMGFIGLGLVMFILGIIGIYQVNGTTNMIALNVIFILIMICIIATIFIAAMTLKSVKSLNSISDSLDEFSEKLGVISKKHETGEIETLMSENASETTFNELAKSINYIIKNYNNIIGEAKNVLTMVALNDFTLKMSSGYKGEFLEFANSVDGATKRLLSVQDAFTKVYKGDTSRLEEFKKIGKRSENDNLMPSVAGTMQIIQDLINETKMLSDAAIGGNLKVRGDISKFDGVYKEIIQGMNNTMDAVVKPIEETLVVMQEMSDGNLTISMNGDYKGDYARLKDAINSTIISFDNVLDEINTASMQVASGSRQVSDSAQTLSTGSTEQASAIEELTSSMEEISAQTMSNAENANKANQLTAITKEGAVKGNQQMQEMLIAMDDINKSSSNIYKIIKVIDEIAFQTNILALNAAVEAARAGQHGKGFAVVAEEVRNLAARSASAAKETTALIEGSIDKAEGGSKIAKQTAEALANIVESVAKSAELVNGIALASNEQAAGIDQVNQGIIQVSQVTQNNSATSEESAAASEELSSQAEMLRQMVSKFKLRKTNVTYNNSVKENYKLSENSNQSKKSEVPKSRAKIILNDNEFGKY